MVMWPGINICLADFDKSMLSEEVGLIRYADNFIVMCKSEEDEGFIFNLLS